MHGSETDGLVSGLRVRVLCARTCAGLRHQSCWRLASKWHYGWHLAPLRNGRFAHGTTLIARDGPGPCSLVNQIASAGVFQPERKCVWCGRPMRERISLALRPTWKIYRHRLTGINPARLQNMSTFHSYRMQAPRTRECLLSSVHAIPVTNGLQQLPSSDRNKQLRSDRSLVH